MIHNLIIAAEVYAGMWAVWIGLTEASRALDRHRRKRAEVTYLFPRQDAS